MLMVSRGKFELYEMKKSLLEMLKNVWAGMDDVLAREEVLAKEQATYYAQGKKLASQGYDYVAPYAAQGYRLLRIVVFKDPAGNIIPEPQEVKPQVREFVPIDPADDPRIALKEKIASLEQEVESLYIPWNIGQIAANQIGTRGGFFNSKPPETVACQKIDEVKAAQEAKLALNAAGVALTSDVIEQNALRVSLEALKVVENAAHVALQVIDQAEAAKAESGSRPKL
jgi:hypothetical protein